MSITGDTGGRQFEDSGRSPSISGKQGTPAMSVASSTALREVPMAGEEGVDRCDGDVTSSGVRTGTQAWAKSGRLHFSAHSPLGGRLRGGEAGSTVEDSSECGRRRRGCADTTGRGIEGMGTVGGLCDCSDGQELSSVECECGESLQLSIPRRRQ